MIHNKQYSEKVPSYHVQVDVKFLKLKNKYESTVKKYQYTAFDDARVLKFKKIYPKQNQAGSTACVHNPAHCSSLVRRNGHRGLIKQSFLLLTYTDDVDLNVKFEA